MSTPPLKPGLRFKGPVHGKKPTESDVIIPARDSIIYQAIEKCAGAGNKVAIECLDAILKIEAGEPVQESQVMQLKGMLAGIATKETP